MQWHIVAAGCRSIIVSYNVRWGSQYERLPMQGSCCCSKNKIYANFTLSNLTCIVASLLLVCLSIFGFSLLLNIQYNNLGDMSWLKMTGSVETVNNEKKRMSARTHTHTHRHTHWLSEILVTQQGGCRQSWSVVFRLQKFQQFKAQTALKAHLCTENANCSFLDVSQSWNSERSSEKEQIWQLVQKKAWRYLFWSHN